MGIQPPKAGKFIRPARKRRERSASRTSPRAATRLRAKSRNLSRKSSIIEPEFPTSATDGHTLVLEAREVCFLCGCSQRPLR